MYVLIMYIKWDINNALTAKIFMNEWIVVFNCLDFLQKHVN